MAIIAIIFTGCSQRMVDFTIISTKNMDLSKANTYKRGQNRANGENGVYWIVTIPLGQPNLKEAIDAAIQSTPGCVALVDGVVYSKGWSAVITAYSAYVVEGTPLIDPSLATMENNQIGKYNICSLDKKGNIKEIRQLSEEEFEIEKSKIVQKNK